jgi:hypothetical protein
MSTFILPCLLIQEVLNAAGFTDVNYDKFENRALAPPEDTPYIFLEDLAGTTPHIEYANRPSMQIVVYAQATTSYMAINQSLGTSQAIQKALKAAIGTAFPEGGIHKVLTRVSPYRQDLAGLPYGVGRTVAQYDFILSNKEKWS